MATMKRFAGYLLLAACSFSVSCESSRYTVSERATDKKIYLNQFKLCYFRKLLEKSYNNSVAVREIIFSDHSGFMEPVLTSEDHRLIDSFTTIDNQLLIADSAKGYQRSEGADGKRPLNFIMDKLRSIWLDSLAKKRYRVNGKW